MSDERTGFSERLAAAMRAQGHEPRPSVLVTQFNLRFSGASVSFQSASRWLRGKGIPQQDKLVVLADWLKLTPDFLRYGNRSGVGKPHFGQVREDPPEYDERRIFDIYRALHATQQKVVREVILAFAATSSRHSRPIRPGAGSKGQRRKP